MNLDAIVWLIAGLGLGLGLSLMLLLAYSGLERVRLRRRLQQHRSAAFPAPSKPVVAPAPLAAPPKSAAVTPKTEPDPIADLPTASSEAAGDVLQGSGVPAVATPAPAPEEQPSAAPPSVVSPRKPQSVEEIFAEAFATDPYVKPDQHGPVVDKG